MKQTSSDTHRSGLSDDNAAKLAYSVPEAVKATSLGRTYIYGKIAEGALRSRKIGNRRVILRADLIEFLQNG